MLRKKSKKPKIITFQMQHGEFLYLGKEYKIVGPIENADMKAIWDDFLATDIDGGYAVIKQYRKNSYECMIVNHNINSEYEVYSPGTIVDGIDEVPEGWALTKFPAREFIVVTHEWISKEESTPIGSCMRYADNLQIPDGYIRYDQPGSQIVLMELSNSDSEQRRRWEIWVPIRKTV